MLRECVTIKVTCTTLGARCAKPFLGDSFSFRLCGGFFFAGFYAADIRNEFSLICNMLCS